MADISDALFQPSGSHGGVIAMVTLLTNKAYLSATTVTNIFQSFYVQDDSKNQLASIDMEQNYATVTLCI